MTRKALGRGLNALLGEAAEPVAAPTSAFQQLPIALIDPNPFQPRRGIAEPQLRELAQSIQSTGIVQPVLVRRAGERYQLVAGERRWRAAAMAQLETVPAIIRELADREALEIALAENVLREDLSPIEVAHAFEALAEKFGYSHEEIAARLGMDRSTVTNTLRLLKLPESIQHSIEKGLLTAGHARALLSCADGAAQLELAARVVEGHLSVRQAEHLAAQGRRQPEPENPPQTRQDANVRAAALELERTLGTRVRISGDGRRGHIEISYYSAEDLNRLYDWMTHRAPASAIG
ncbi:MAG: ParB/RepB/Spo0J family partition protein [Terriglobia bacterium]